MTNGDHRSDLYDSLLQVFYSHTALCGKLTESVYLLKTLLEPWSPLTFIIGKSAVWSRKGFKRCAE